MSKVRREKSAFYTTIKKGLKDLKKHNVKTGFFSSSKYADGTPVAYVAAIQEFLDGGSRSFMRTTMIEKEKEWAKIMEKFGPKIMDGSMSVTDALNIVGLRSSGDVAAKIAEITAPPLKPATIKARQRKLANNEKVGNLTKPLIESAVMFNSVTHEVD